MRRRQLQMSKIGWRHAPAAVRLTGSMRQGDVRRHAEDADGQKLRAVLILQGCREIEGDGGIFRSPDVVHYQDRRVGNGLDRDLEVRARGRRRAVRGLPRLGHQGQRHGAAPVGRRRQLETGELRRRHGPCAIAVIGAGGEARSRRQSLDRHRQHLGTVRIGQQRREVECNRLILLPRCITHRDSGSVGDSLHRHLERQVRRGGDAVRTHGIGLKGQVDRA